MSSTTSNINSLLKMFSIILIALQVGAALANTEKVIFLGPSTLQIPVEPPTLENLQLDTLSPAAWSVRTHVEAEFPTDIAKYGQSKWLLLHSLEEGRRYEVRICWAATVCSTASLKRSKLT
jgi:hypothetical protein